MSTLNTTVKLSQYIFDSEKKPEAYPKWESDIMSAVESSDYGYPLNEFLRRLWGVDAKVTHSVPAWQLEDKFCFEPTVGILEDLQEEVIENATSPTKSAESGEAPKQRDSRLGSSSSKKPHSYGKYHGMDFSTFRNIATNCPEAVELDQKLYPLLKTCITGPWNEIVEHVKQPSYMLAMATLHDHHNISRLAQKTEAMEELANNRYKNDPKAYKARTLAAVAKVRRAGCTVEDFILRDILGSFDPSSHRSIRYDIAKTINTTVVDHAKLYDMLQGICS